MKEEKRFRPSDILINFIRKGRDKNLFLNKKDVLDGLPTVVERMFSTLGFRELARLNINVPITDSGKFLPNIREELLDRIWPGQAIEFIEGFEKELKAFLLDNGRVGGDWGKLRVIDDDIYMCLGIRDK